VETVWLIAAVVVLHAVSIGIAWLIVRDLVRSDRELPPRRDGGDAWRWRRRPPQGGRPHDERPASAAASRAAAGR
jgi:hypothetical protein